MIGEYESVAFIHHRLIEKNVVEKKLLSVAKKLIL